MAAESMTMLEKIARAIAERQMRRDQRKAVEGGCDVFLAIDPYLGDAREDARAAVEAMRDPSETMEDAALENVPDGYWNYRADGRPGGPDDVWQAMIDAILNEEKQK